jgi:hypothetical protein
LRGKVSWSPTNFTMWRGIHGWDVGNAKPALTTKSKARMVERRTVRKIWMANRPWRMAHGTWHMSVGAWQDLACAYSVLEYLGR